jgi:ATP-dependent RNA helicase DDX41
VLLVTTSRSLVTKSRVAWITCVPARPFRSSSPTVMSDHEPTIKRRRVQRSPSPQYRIENDDDYEPYVPVAQRRQAKLAKLSAWGSSATRDDAREARRVEEEREDEEQEEERRREKVRRGRALLVEAQEVHSKKASEGVWLLHCT